MKTQLLYNNKCSLTKRKCLNLANFLKAKVFTKTVHGEIQDVKIAVNKMIWKKNFDKVSRQSKCYRNRQDQLSYRNYFPKIT